MSFQTASKNTSRRRVSLTREERIVLTKCNDTLETKLIYILLLASRDVHFDKRMICFLSDLL